MATVFPIIVPQGLSHFARLTWLLETRVEYAQVE